MKYIRTKEGNIYQRFFKDKSIRGVGGDGCCDKNLNPIGETIIKESDTIEELCDGFIGLSTKAYPNRPDIELSIHYFSKPFEFKYGNNMNTHLKLIDVELTNQNGWTHPTKEWFETCDIYGFIRTSKGLIYVAKMNENGELELL